MAERRRGRSALLLPRRSKFSCSCRLLERRGSRTPLPFEVEAFLASRLSTSQGSAGKRVFQLSVVRANLALGERGDEALRSFVQCTFDCDVEVRSIGLRRKLFIKEGRRRDHLSNVEEREELRV